MQRRVEPSKPVDKFNGIMLIGEAAGETEERLGKPFMGYAGKQLDSILEEVGISRDSTYITNVYKYRPRANNFASIDRGDLAHAIGELQQEMMEVQPTVIVCLGEHALEAVTDKKGVTRHRGSIYSTVFGKVIPTIHPAAILRDWTYRPLVVCDMRKAAWEAQFRDIRHIKRNLRINPTYQEIKAYLEHILHGNITVAFDIEVETRQISCIAFAIDGADSMCIPFWFGASGSMWSKEQELSIWELIKQVLEHPGIKKIAQNATYDMTILRDLYDINVQGLWLDTMIAFHAIYPELPKNLALLTSLYTDVPFYKSWRLTRDMSEFFRYNAMDAAVTYECAMKIMKEMEEFDVKDFYYEHMHSLITPLLDITRRGVRVDTKRKKEVKKALKEKVKSLQEKLDTLVGHELNVNSTVQMKKWLYEELKLPQKKKRRKGKEEDTLTADAETLDAFYVKTQNEALRTVIEIREAKKLLSTYLEVKYDREEEGERAKTSYLISGTETGRLSSRETVYGTGTNMQNIPRGSFRRMFIPDDDKVFINADLSQAEARVVAALAGETRLMQIFERGGDIHRRNAANIFRKPEEEVTYDERTLAKRIIHASNYGMGPVTFAKTAGISIPESKRLLNAYFAEYPRIRLWHMQIASILKRSGRVLVTPLGRKRIFLNKWNDALLKEAYAYQAQSTVADLLNMGLRATHEHYKNSDVEILLQIHDAILLQCPRDMVPEVARTVKRLLEIPIEINNHTLLIPADITVGDSWGSLEDYDV